MELWVSDGKEGGTVLTKDINPGSAPSRPEHLMGVHSLLYLRADDGSQGLSCGR
jgi:ELWxxDGT repeat protein